MTRRDRLQARLERRLAWAESRNRQAASAASAAHRAVEGIPLGQPILVGHHSQRRHERALERADNAMARACEAEDMAKHHRARADGLEAQLASSIYSDDPDAVEALEAKAQALEARRDRMKAINVALRRGKPESLVPPLSDAERAELTNLARFSYNAKGGGFPAYALTNLGGRIRQARERLAEVQRRQALTAQATDAPEGCAIAEAGGWAIVTFAEKPERTILEALRGAGFRWGGGSWRGPSTDVPACVRALVGAP
jgi:DNA repair exonuclease SbcCD ATPase subunit